jgi:hypothetical protein
MSLRIIKNPKTKTHTKRKGKKSLACLQSLLRLLHQCEDVYPDNYACYLDTHHGTDAKYAHNYADKPPTRQIKAREDPIGSGFGLGLG